MGATAVNADKERDGVDMKEIHFDDIVRTVAELAIEACYRLPDDMVAAMRAARTREPSPVGRNILDQLLEMLKSPPGAICPCARIPASP